MTTLAHKLKHELRELIPVTLFFFVSFQLLALTEALILRQYGIPATAFLAATVAALVVAKVVIITDHFALVNRFPDGGLAASGRGLEWFPVRTARQIPRAKHGGRGAGSMTIAEIEGGKGVRNL